MSERQIDQLLSDLYEELGQNRPARSPMALSAVQTLADASGLGLPSILKQLHAKAAARVSPVPSLEAYYRKNVPLPAGLTVEGTKEALDYTQELMAMLNEEIREQTGVPLSDLIQANNFGGIVSNLIAVAMERHTPFARNSDQKHPDLKHCETGLGIEIKAANKAGKGGEGHNGLAGWHMIACYRLDPKAGLIRFVHVEIAELVSYQAENDGDWKYIGSTRSDEGTQRTETYCTTARGTWKLRHGSVYLDQELWPNWKNLASHVKRGGAVPNWSPWTSDALR